MRAWILHRQDLGLIVSSDLRTDEELERFINNRARVIPGRSSQGTAKDDTAVILPDKFSGTSQH